MTDDAGVSLLEAISRINGVPEVSVDWLHENPRAARVVDCRESDELVGPLGAIDGVEHVPLGEFPGACSDWNRDEPLAIICRSGGRSAHAAMMLERSGFTAVASVAGGMMDWRERGYPIA